MTQGVEHYLSSGELPTDPAVLAELYQEMVSSESTTNTVEAEESAGATTGAVGDKAVGKVAIEKEPDGILTKDGKHVIPYDVLKNDRLRHQEEKSSLIAEIESLKQSNTPVDLSALGLLTEEQLAEQKEYFPESYDALVTQQNNLIALHSQVEQDKQVEQQRLAERQRTEQLNIQELIDSNPVLSHWQQNDPEAWAYAVQQDNLLSGNPKFAAMSMADRFNKAAELALQVYESPVKSAKSTKVEPAKVTHKPVINSLSDITSGVDNVSTQERSMLEDMSPQALDKLFRGKTSEQINALIANMQF